MKKEPQQSNKSNSMAVDLFEREYAGEIAWQVEVLLIDAKERSEDGRYSESDYDEAYEQAIVLVACDMGIELI